MKEIQDKTSRLEHSINLLEEHLQKYRDVIEPRPLKFIESQIGYYKRELKKN